MIVIDGSLGEGGGQIIRTSLALSLVTGKAFRAEHVRARRERPGLQPQHLTAVNAAARVGGAETDGARVGSQQFSFHPGRVTPGDYGFNIGTAGSTTLVLQTVLPPLMLAASPSVLTLEGGTHNVHAPPFEFIERAFLPLVNRIGLARVSIELERYGFYPPGGGKLNVFIEPGEAGATRREFHLSHRGEMRRQTASALVVKLPSGIAERELAVIKERMNWADEQLRVETSTNALSPGNVVTIEIESEGMTEIFTGIGQRGVRAEQVAEDAIEEAQRHLATDAPVGEHLADQLLIPLALAGGGSYRTSAPSLHTTTNIEVIKKFLGADITATPDVGGAWKIEVQLLSLLGV